MATLTSQKLNKYQRFETAIHAVARGWNNDIELKGRDGFREIYLAVSRLIVTRAFETGIDLPAQWSEPGSVAHDGMRVIALHCHYAGLAAGCQGRSIEDLEAALRSSDSFVPLEEITLLHHDIAGRVETEHGMNRMEYDDGVTPIVEERYSVERGAILMPRLNREIGRQIAIGEKRRDGHGCRAHQAGVLETIRQHIVTICLCDERLAAASLARATQLSLG